MRVFVYAVAVLYVFAAVQLPCAQAATTSLFDSFSDGNFSSPVWTGDNANWTIVANSTAGPGASASQTLRLGATVAAAGVQQLRTEVVVWGRAQQWSLWFGRRTQSASAANRVLLWLYATEPSLTSASVDGYALAFGDDSGGDELRLVRVDNGVETAIATSATAVPNNTLDYGIAVRVLRSENGVWQLYSSTLASLSAGGGVAADVAQPTLFLQATAVDNLYVPSTGGYVGIVASHTSGDNPRTAVEFDQCSLLVFDYPSVVIDGARTACTGTTALYSVPQAEGVEYSWSIDGGRIIAGQHTREIAVVWSAVTQGSIAVIAYDGLYTSTASVRVDLCVMPDSSVVASGALTWCGTGSVVLTAGEENGDYRWSNGVTSRSIRVATSGNYSVVVTTPCGCSVESAPVVVTVLPVLLHVRVLLEGARVDEGMSTDLYRQELIPLEQPYDREPFWYAGQEELQMSSDSLVDWVLLELRTRADDTAAERRAVLLLSDGRLVASNGDNLSIEAADSTAYYIVVHHRNHLSVMSAYAVQRTDSCSLVYDFTTNAASAYTQFMVALKQYTHACWVVPGGDADANGVINAADRVLVRSSSGSTGYLSADVSMDGVVNAVDRVLARSNVFRIRQLPEP